MEGFTYRGIHCEVMGVTYIPDASVRFNASPNVSLSTDTVNWRDGDYFYNTRRQSRTFTLNCYFENISMDGRERIRRWLDEKQSGDLIFDDRPYVKYKVRPSKVTTGKIYLQQEGYKYRKYYNGTLTITFVAHDPLGHLIQTTDEDVTDFDQYNDCNLLRSDMMPSKPAVTDRNFMIYNPGTLQCGVTFVLAGTAPNGLTITNKTNGTRCVLRGLPSTGTLHVNSATGLVSTVYGVNDEEPTFAYHDIGYVQLVPNDQMNFMVQAEYTSGSRYAELYPVIPEDMTGMYLYIDDDWNKINLVSDENVATLERAAESYATGKVHTARFNEIQISGDDLNLTTLDYSLEPRTI